MSETTNLKLFKHDNPSTNQNLFDITKSLNNNWDKIDDFAEAVNDKTIEIEDNIETLEAEDTIIKQDITNIKEEQIVQNNNINSNKTEISKLKEENERLKTKNTEQDSEITKIRKEQEIKFVTVTASQLIQAETEYTLPLNYQVGNHSLRVHWENVLLEEGEDGNYMEIGDKDSISNKIIFGWDIEPGETLIIEVRGVVDE